MTETIMSKGQRGNKEAKKPKKAPVPAIPPVTGGPTQAAAMSPRLRK
jgi:hypothetical protein